MSAIYTFDVFSSLDGYASHKGDWGGYWGKQGPELLEHRRAFFDAEQRMVFGATTFRDFEGMSNTWRGRSSGSGPRPSRAETPSMSSPGSRRSPTCRCARTAG